MKNAPTDARGGGGAAPDGFVFEISGGHLALDFTNTVSGRSSDSGIREHLTHYGRLVTWSEQAGILTEKDGRRLRAEADERPAAAATTLRRAVALREAIFSLFRDLASGEPPPRAALDTLNEALPDALSCLRVRPEREGFSWRWECGEGSLTQMLAPVVRAAADLLTSPDLARVRECHSETCAWLFLDRSKNATRRWCDMTVCGNRAKARRHYARERKAARGRSSKRGGANPG